MAVGGLRCRGRGSPEAGCGLPRMQPRCRAAALGRLVPGRCFEGRVEVQKAEVGDESDDPAAGGGCRPGTAVLMLGSHGEHHEAASVVAVDATETRRSAGRRVRELLDEAGTQRLGGAEAADPNVDDVPLGGIVRLDERPLRGRCRVVDDQLSRRAPLRDRPRS